MEALSMFSFCVEAHVLLGLCASSFAIAESNFQLGLLNIPNCLNMKKMEVLVGGDAWGFPAARAVYRLRLGLTNMLRKQVQPEASISHSCALVLRE
jgi:hypothetical protein